MSRRPPRTSYGYLAPRGARVTGWRCDNEDCGKGERPAPRSWPYLCPGCHRPTDPTFDEPWAHLARGYQLRHDRTSAEQLRRTLRPSRRRLAILSACETNLTDTAVPNEVVGLPSALIEVGFAGVVAASWTVDDLATTYLMTMFYQFWCHEGFEPAVALNRAQRWLRSATRSDLTALIPGIEPRGGSGDYPYLDPRYWAAFAYTGA